LVVEDNGEPEGLQRLRKGQRALRLGAERAIHIAGESDDDGLDAFGVTDAADRCQVCRARRPPQGAQRRGEPAGHIADGETDPALAHVKSKVTHEAYCTMEPPTLLWPTHDHLDAPHIRRHVGASRRTWMRRISVGTWAPHGGDSARSKDATSVWRRKAAAATS